MYRKLTKDNVGLIRSEFMKNKYYTKGSYLQAVRLYAKAFNVSRKTIQDVINFRSWKHVPVYELEEDPALTRSVLELEKLDPWSLVWFD